MLYNIFLSGVTLEEEFYFYKQFINLIRMENEKTKSGLCFEAFKKQVDGKETSICVLSNKKGAEAVITNYGAKIVSLMVPDNKGKWVDVVLGHASIDDYLSSGEPTFGATCGRYANRIAKGRFVLDGTVYDQLAINNGPNSLHGGLRGFHFRVWDMEQVDPQTARLTYVAADGEEGYPGELTAVVTYHLADDNEMVISYQAKTTKPTVVNLTNHSYFNLSGEGDRYSGDHMLMIDADAYLPTDETAIPYGPQEKVAGTPMDFTQPHEIGERINDSFQQLIFGKGYDHCYVLNKEGNEMALASRCYSPKTGIVMETYTTEPGIQLYTANWLNESIIGKNGHPYPERCSFCLETQHFPDSPNKPEYPSTVLRPGEIFQSQTVYKFSVE